MAATDKLRGGERKRFSRKGQSKSSRESYGEKKFISRVFLVVVVSSTLHELLSLILVSSSDVIFFLLALNERGCDGAPFTILLQL